MTARRKAFPRGFFSGSPPTIIVIFYALFAGRKYPENFQNCRISIKPMTFLKKNFTQPRRTYKAGNVQFTRGICKPSGLDLKELLLIILKSIFTVP
jgi:hypothetical protein